MTANLNPVTLYALTALANSIQEHCGYILNDGTVVVVPNSSKTPRETFEMDQDSQYATVTALHAEIVGMFHTHPRGVCWPSETDKGNWPEAARIGGVRYFIATTREVNEFRMENGVVKPVE